MLHARLREKFQIDRLAEIHRLIDVGVRLERCPGHGNEAFDLCELGPRLVSGLGMLIGIDHDRVPRAGRLDGPLDRLGLVGH